MKYIFLVSIICIIAVHCNFDFTHHQTGHQLCVSLKDETDKIWVVFAEKNPGGDEGKDLISLNKEVQNQLKQKIYNESVYYTEVDLTAETTVNLYQDFINMTELDTSLLDEGPVVMMIYNREGFWIHGQGIPQEAADTIHDFTAKKQSNDEKNGPVSLGGADKTTVTLHDAAY